MVNLSQFIKEHIPLCFCTLGIAILGYLGYHTVKWIINKCHKTEKIDDVAQKSISIASAGNVATTKIQSAIPEHAERLAFEQKSAAALKIQSFWRGHCARVKAEKVKKHLLSYALLEKAKPYVDIPSNLQGVPLASFGKTSVFLPKELPIVLKRSGSPANQIRFEKMKQARDLCEKSCYENLVIPKARVYGNFIVESRLPITVHGTKEQIGLYIENQERFTGAVQEFTGFLCQSWLYDITGGCNDPYGTLSDSPVGRYDNVALYLEGNQGKIGLIDLEKFEPESNQLQKEWCFFRCLNAVHLFPHHLDEIMSVAKRFDSNIEAYRAELKNARYEALKRFKVAYEDHLDFIKEKKITLENPLEIVGITPLRKENIKKAMVLLICKEHDRGRYEKCLGEKPERVITLFENSFPKILDMTTAFISEILKKKIESTQEAISTYGQLLSCRTLRFKGSGRPYQDLQKKVVSELQMMEIEDEGDKFTFGSLIIESIFSELAMGREIAYYNPSFGYGGHATQCIFC